MQNGAGHNAVVRLFHAQSAYRNALALYRIAVRKYIAREQSERISHLRSKYYWSLLDAICPYGARNVRAINDRPFAFSVGEGFFS